MQGVRATARQTSAADHILNLIRGSHSVSAPHRCCMLWDSTDRSNGSLYMWAVSMLTHDFGVNCGLLWPMVALRSS